MKTDSTSIADIKDISVAHDLPKEERVTEFVRQMGDPYHYRCEDMTFTAKFTQGGPTLEDCLLRLFA